MPKQTLLLLSCFVRYFPTAIRKGADTGFLLIRYTTGLPQVTKTLYQLSKQPFPSLEPATPGNYYSILCLYELISSYPCYKWTTCPSADLINTISCTFIHILETDRISFPDIIEKKKNPKTENKYLLMYKC